MADWSAIRTALAARIAAASGTQCHSRQEWTDGSPTSRDWRTLFGEDEGAGTDTVHFWEITRMGRTATDHEESDDVIVTRFRVALAGYLSHDSEYLTEDDFQDIIDAISEDLETGDRTLGGVCNTHGLPSFGTIGYGELVDGVWCHVARADFEIEVQETRSVSGTSGTDQGDTGFHESELKEVGDALITFLSSSVVSPLGLVSWGWTGRPTQDLIYPSLPRTRLPKATLRAVSGNSNSATIGACKANAEYVYEIRYYAVQVPGQDHHERTLRALKRFVDPFARTGFAPQLGVNGFTEIESTLIEAIEDDLDHPLGDPNLRVSCFGINLTIRGQTQGPVS